MPTFCRHHRIDVSRPCNLAVRRLPPQPERGSGRRTECRRRRGEASLGRRRRRPSCRACIIVWLLSWSLAVRCVLRRQVSYMYAFLALNCALALAVQAAVKRSRCRRAEVACDRAHTGSLPCPAMPPAIEERCKAENSAVT